MDTASPPSRIFLIGMMGAGKSYEAARMAQQLGYTALDTDALLEAQLGCTIAHFFTTEGEAAFRAAEQALLLHYPWPQRIVVACGGGLPCYQHNMDLLLQLGHVIWLNPSLDTLEHRLLQEADKRPLIATAAKEGRLRAQLEGLLQQRVPTYARANEVMGVG